MTAPRTAPTVPGTSTLSGAVSGGSTPTTAGVATLSPGLSVQTSKALLFALGHLPVKYWFGPFYSISLWGPLAPEKRSEDSGINACFQLCFEYIWGCLRFLKRFGASQASG